MYLQTALGVSVARELAIKGHIEMGSLPEVLKEIPTLCVRFTDVFQGVPFPMQKLY